MAVKAKAVKKVGGYPIVRNKSGRRIISVEERRTHRKRMFARRKLHKLDASTHTPTHSAKTGRSWSGLKGPFFQPWHTSSVPFQGIVGGKKRGEMLAAIKKARAGGLRGHAAATAGYHAYIGSRKARLKVAKARRQAKRMGMLR